MYTSIYLKTFQVSAAYHHMTLKVHLTSSETRWAHNPAFFEESDMIVVPSVVHLLPHYCPTDAKEVPQIADYSPIKRVFFIIATPKVWDSMSRHKLPGGGVDGDQVQVAAHEHCHHKWKYAYNTQCCQKKPIHCEPQLPSANWGDAWPVWHRNI